MGVSLPEAHRTWADRTSHVDDVLTMSQLFDRYQFEILPTKAFATERDNLTSLGRLRTVFGQLPLADGDRNARIEPHHVYQHRDAVHKKLGPGAANRDVAVIMHAFSMAVQWGYVRRNPIKGQVRKISIPPRDRYVEDWEIEALLSVASPVIRAYVVLKLLMGLRRGDMLRLSTEDITDAGVHVRPQKTAKTSGMAMTFEWTPALQVAVDAAISARPKDVVPWLFCTRRGDPYVNEDGIADGFSSIWRRAMDKALRDTALECRFQEKDLRKKVATDTSEEHARQLLGHTSISTTRRHYRLKGALVRPAK